MNEWKNEWISSPSSSSSPAAAAAAASYASLLFISLLDTSCTQRTVKRELDSIVSNRLSSRDCPVSPNLVFVLDERNWLAFLSFLYTCFSNSQCSYRHSNHNNSFFLILQFMCEIMRKTGTGFVNRICSLCISLSEFFSLTKIRVFLLSSP